MSYVFEVDCDLGDVVDLGFKRKLGVENDTEVTYGRRCEQSVDINAGGEIVGGFDE